MSIDTERATRREERERETIVALAMIAPTSDLIRRVLMLRRETDGEVTPKRPTEIVPDREPATARR